ncbi:MAG: DUF2283 domain-containing protein [Chloroflexota bacterium]
MQLTYDELTDTLYVYFTQEPVARTRELSERVIVDYDERGSVRGIEILDATLGPAIEAKGLPRLDDFTRVVQKARELPVPA